MLKIISGGQTGSDRGALDAAIEFGIEHGGYVPKGRRAEDGRVPPAYRLVELGSPNYLTRTRLNVESADGTLILTPQRSPTGGTFRTIEFAIELQKPWWVSHPGRLELVPKVVAWIQEKNLKTINVGGPRESKFPGVQGQSRIFLLEVFKILAQDSKSDV